MKKAKTILVKYIFEYGIIIETDETCIVDKTSINIKELINSAAKILTKQQVSIDTLQHGSLFEDTDGAYLEGKINDLKFSADINFLSYDPKVKEIMNLTQLKNAIKKSKYYKVNDKLIKKLAIKQKEEQRTKLIEQVDKINKELETIK